MIRMDRLTSNHGGEDGMDLSRIACEPTKSFELNSMLDLFMNIGMCVVFGVIIIAIISWLINRKD
jgi:hypothetical protein